MRSQFSATDVQERRIMFQNTGLFGAKVPAENGVILLSSGRARRDIQLEKALAGRKWWPIDFKDFTRRHLGGLVGPYRKI